MICSFTPRSPFVIRQRSRAAGFGPRGVPGFDRAVTRARARGVRRNAPSHWAVVVLGALLILVSTGARAMAEVRVVTTTPNLADIVQQIGGDLVTVHAVMRGPEDVHNVSPRPSQMIKLKNADMFVHQGLDAELWAPLLVKGARNPKVLYGQPGNVDVSRGIKLKEVPSKGGRTRALGDIHAYGNTHYALDPLNGVIMARTITDALKQLDPSHADTYESRYNDYTKRLRDLTKELQEKLKPYAGTQVATYHRAWPYFLERFGLVAVAEVEPKPGIAPGPQHLQQCIETMKANHARVVIVETYNKKSNADFVADHVNGKAVVLSMEVHGLPEIKTYEDLFRVDVQRLVDAFDELGLGKDSSASTGAKAGAHD